MAPCPHPLPHPSPPTPSTQEVADLTADGLSAYLLAKNGVHQPAKGNGAGAKKGSGSREPAIKAQALPATHAPRSAAGPHVRRAVFGAPLRLARAAFV